MFELNVSKINIFVKKVQELASDSDWKTGKLYVKYIASQRIINPNILQNANLKLKQNAQYNLNLNSLLTAQASCMQQTNRTVFLNWFTAANLELKIYILEVSADGEIICKNQDVEAFEIKM